MASSSRLAPTGSAGSDSRAIAGALATVIRWCVSKAMMPSAIPAKIASRCSARAAISAGSIPSVPRLIQRASNSEPPTPSSSAAPR